MYNNETIEILNMFAKAANIAKARNQYEYNQEIGDAILSELLKQAYPHNRNVINSLSLIKNMRKIF